MRISTWLPSNSQPFRWNFTQALNQLATATSGAPGFGLAQVTQALGKALIYDQTLSVNNNLACATCHDSLLGFHRRLEFFQCNYLG